MRNPYNKNLLLSLGLIFLILFCNVFLNRLVDPYGYFSEPRITNFNENKIYINRNRSVLGAKPNTLILGSSRAYLGLNPKDTAWQGRKVFNLASGGDNIFDSFHLLEHASENGKVQEVYLMVDFFMFNAIRKPYKKEEYKFLSSISTNENMTKTNIFGSLFSFKTLIHSFGTVIGQQKYTSDLMDYGLFSFNSGFPSHSKFLSIESSFYKVHYRNFAIKTADTNMLDGFKAIINYAHKNNIKLTIGISPMHSRLLEVIAVAGLWDDFENWKISLANLMSPENYRDLPNQFMLYDFATFNQFTSEEGPLQNKHRNVEWFSDPSHYDRKLGTKIINRMFGIPQEDSQFGVLIDTSNIQEHLLKVKHERSLWRKQHPMHFNEIQSMIR